jgi:hypothetical protein
MTLAYLRAFAYLGILAYLSISPAVLPTSASRAGTPAEIYASEKKSGSDNGSLWYDAMQESRNRCPSKKEKTDKKSLPRYRGGIEMLGVFAKAARVGLVCSARQTYPCFYVTIPSLEFSTLLIF